MPRLPAALYAATALPLLVACAGGEPSSYYGTWVVDGENENELLMFAFFEDGTYIHAEYDAEEAGGEVSGMEWGTISVDEDGRVEVGAASFDGNGETGLTDFVGTGDLALSVEGDSLTIDVVGGEEEGNTLPFSRVESTGDRGSFYSYDTENELLAFSFLPGDVYCHFEYDEQPGEEISGMECATYSLGADGTMSVEAGDVLVDNNGDTGLTDFVGTSDLQLHFDETSLTLDIVGGEEAPGSIVLQRLP